MNHIASQSRVPSVAPPAETYAGRHDPGSAVKAVVICIILILTAGFVWAANSRIAIMAGADGRVVPPERVQLLGHAEGGTVAALHVRIGQHVTAGDSLIDLDSTAARADLAQQVAEGEALKGDIRRLEAESLGMVPDFAGLLAATVTQQSALFRTRHQRHSEELRVVQSEIDAARAGVDGISATLAPLRQRMTARQGLAEKGLASRFQVSEDEARIAELSGRLQEGLANGEKARRRMTAIDGAWQEEIARALKEAHAKLDSLSSLRPKLERRLDGMHIIAPVSGVIKTVSATGPGATLRPGEPAVEIVPDDVRRMINVKLPAGEVGHVRVGQRARITLIPPDGHLAPLYGIVAQIAPDSSADEHSRQFNYLVDIIPEAAEFQGEQGETYPLSPGVPVSVTIITGTRTVLGAVAGPLFAGLERAVSER